MKKRIINHIIFWLAYLSSQIYIEYAWSIQYYPKQSLSEIFFMAFAGEFSLLPARIPVVYFSFLISDYLTSVKSSYVKAGLYYLILLLLFTTLYRIIIVTFALPNIYDVKEPEEVFLPERFVRAFLDLSFLFAAANATRLYLGKQQMQDRENELLKQKAEVELKQLKSQLNPHFLFNTLNSIYVLALKSSNQTPEIVMRLSELLRFMLYESGKAYITIEQEAKVIEDYLALEKIRYTDRLKLQFTKNVDEPNALITPLLLLPLVENAFKHGASESRREAFININYQLKDKIFTFGIMNSKEKTVETAQNNGIGLANVKRQLELSYSNFSFEVEDKENTFGVKIEIRLN